MAVLERTTLQKNITTQVFMCMLIGALLFTGLLLFASSQMASNGTLQASGGVGPLKLFELTRQPLAGGGYTAGIRYLQNGLMSYFVVWLGLGLALGIYRSKRA